MSLTRKLSSIGPGGADSASVIISHSRAQDPWGLCRSPPDFQKTLRSPLWTENHGCGAVRAELTKGREGWPRPWTLLPQALNQATLDMSARLPAESFHQYIGVGDSGLGLWSQREYLSELGEPAEKCERTGFRKLLGSSLATALWDQGRETQ